MPRARRGPPARHTPALPCSRATRKLGFAVARALAARGAAVGITATSGRVHERAAELEAAGFTAWAATPDLVDEGAAAHLVGAVPERFGRLDALVDNAGMTQTGGEELSARFVDKDARRRQLALERNLTTAVNMTRAALPAMLERRYGRIVNLSSVPDPLVAIAGESGYAAAKAGLEGSTRALALELGTFGITVNAVAPGWIATSSSTPAEREAGRHTPIGRPGKPEEVAAAVAFLADPSRSPRHRRSLVVEGGNTLQEIKH